jgi:hypothetical protein
MHASPATTAKDSADIIGAAGLPLSATGPGLIMLVRTMAKLLGCSKVIFCPVVTCWDGEPSVGV